MEQNELHSLRKDHHHYFVRSTHSGTNFVDCVFIWGNFFSALL